MADTSPRSIKDCGIDRITILVIKLLEYYMLKHINAL